MAYPNGSRANAGAETEITLGLLTAIERNSAVSQRSVAKDLGIALGLTNAYLKRCVKKGLIKVTQVPANRYAYFLTPKGFAEKSRLTARYLIISMDFFRQARRQCDDVFKECRDRGWRRIALHGAGELADIAVLCAGQYGAALVGVIDSKYRGASVSGLRVAPSAADFAPLDAVIVTDCRDPQKTYNNLSREFPAERILTPRFLHISRVPPPFAP